MAPRDVEELAGLPVGYLGIPGPNIRLLVEGDRPDVLPLGS